MMMAIRVGRKYAKFFPRFRSSSGAQFHSQSNSSRLSNQNPYATTKKEAVSVLFGCGLIHISSGWISSNGRSMYEEWKAKIKMQKMLEELDRKKKDSPEAYLEMIHREIEALKPRLLEREEMAEWEFNKYEREIAVLKSKLYEWTQGKDVPAPAPAPAPQV